MEGLKILAKSAAGHFVRGIEQTFEPFQGQLLLAQVVLDTAGDVIGVALKKRLDLLGCSGLGLDPEQARHGQTADQHEQGPPTWR